MQLRGFSPRTHTSYLAAVKDLARYSHRSPEQLSIEQIQAYFLYLVKERHLSWSSCRLLIRHTLKTQVEAERAQVRRRGGRGRALGRWGDR